ncbi:MAG: UDP-N-acetylglucosamine 2-epimerase (non-hydrolyzing) [Candidatus Acidiferrum sp.]|jgi:UDP-N-acetylglucosamine 2-epimerase (non-hydrolysing)
MKIMLIVGARPNFMKAAPLIAAIREHNRTNGTQESIHPILVHTGQHYGEAMSGSFFTDLDLPKPDVHLEVGSASHATQTAEIMRRFEEVLLAEKPDALIVVGDVNSTVACALVASKISFDSNGRRPLIAHVEAGLRSFDRGMPEEVNRIVTDHLSDLLFVTEESGIQNLIHEGVPNEKIHFAGNTMIDSLLAFKAKADNSTVLDKLGLRNGSANGGVARYALLTLHRPSNVDHRETFLSIFEGLKELSRSCPIIFPAHPRTQQRIAEFGLAEFFESGNGEQLSGEARQISQSKRVRLVDPLGYLDFMCMMKNAALVITDSGGIQEETTCLGVPCVTVRENTERPVTVACGTNVIAGTKADGIRKAIREQGSRLRGNRMPEKWDGSAGTRIVEVIRTKVLESSVVSATLS